MNEKNNTAHSFRDKWEHNKQLAFADTLREDSDIYQWILTRNGFTGAEALRGYLLSKKRILDAGCGNGRVTALLRTHSDPETTQVVGVDLVAAPVAAENLATYANVMVREANLLSDLTALGRFDFIYCQEVLHHTEDPRRGFANLCALLEPRGEIAIYVYKQKAPAREFMDDYVRERVAHLPYAQAVAVMDSITELGRALDACAATVRVPEVPVLGIVAGEYTVQRFVYNFFCKCFWNPELGFAQSSVINYDWYHPQLCTRHTMPEILNWFAQEGLTVTQQCEDPYGITVRGMRGI